MFKVDNKTLDYSAECVQSPLTERRQLICSAGPTFPLTHRKIIGILMISGETEVD